MRQGASRPNIKFLPRDAMHKRGLCSHACLSVCVCVCVCVSVTFVDCVKTNKHIFEIFFTIGYLHHSSFPYQMGWQYSDGNPPNGAWNAGGVGRNRDSAPACC